MLLHEVFVDLCMSTVSSISAIHMQNTKVVQTHLRGQDITISLPAARADLRF